MVSFKKQVSKGSRFNQIYVPKELASKIEVGDEVEVRLLKKAVSLNYSYSIHKISPFKERIIKNIFSILQSIKSITNVCVVGSFLTKKIMYRDVDIVVITKEKNKGIEQKVYKRLLEDIELNFHVISLSKQELDKLLSICPLTRMMFQTYISNTPLDVKKNKRIDKKHIQFLLMMPIDLLTITLESRVFYDALRRLITIDVFLENKPMTTPKIHAQIEHIIGERTTKLLQENKLIDEAILKKLRIIMRKKINSIRKDITHGESKDSKSTNKTNGDSTAT